MKKFFGEFKKFITRGNVLDMAVGVIVGGAFTAIVTALSNNILKPIINWVLALILGKASLSEVFTFLKYVENADGTVDLASSIYIDWGAFINAIINFILIAFVLFLIIRMINKVSERRGQIKDKIKKGRLTKEQKKELKVAGIKRSDKEAVKAYFDAKAAKEAEEAELKKQEEEEAARIERLNNPTTEDLLKQIKALLEQTISATGEEKKKAVKKAKKVVEAVENN